MNSFLSLRWDGVRVFGCNLPPTLLAGWPGSLTCTAVTRGWYGYRNKSQHRQLTLEKKFLPQLLPRQCPALYHWAIPAPVHGLLLLRSNMIPRAWWYLELGVPDGLGGCLYIDFLSPQFILHLHSIWPRVWSQVGVGRTCCSVTVRLLHCWFACWSY